MSQPVAQRNIRSRKIYYGWVIVATGFAAFSVIFAVQYSFGIFFASLQETFGWSRATTSGVMTVHLMLFALCMLPAGWAIDHFNPRIVYSIAALLVGVSLISCSLMSEPWQLYLAYGLPLGISIGTFAGTIQSIVTRWFTNRRGMALGITSAGSGFGTLVGAPLSNALIVSYGWRNSFAILGAVSCIILLVCAYFISGSPQPGANQTSKPSHGSGEGNTAPGPASPRGLSLRQAIKTREMLLIVLTQLFASFTLRMVMVHVAPYASDIGITPSTAALAVGTIGGVSILGRLVMGFVQDKIGPQRSRIICLGIQGVSMLALPFARSDLLFFAYAVVFGFTYGGDYPQIPAITAQCFGTLSIGVIYGMVQTAGNFAGALGPIAAGYAFDLTGSYTTVFLVAAVGLFASVFFMARLGPVGRIGLAQRS